MKKASVSLLTAFSALVVVTAFFTMHEVRSNRTVVQPTHGSADSALGKQAAYPSDRWASAIARSQAPAGAVLTPNKNAAKMALESELWIDVDLSQTTAAEASRLFNYVLRCEQTKLARKQAKIELSQTPEADKNADADFASKEAELKSLDVALKSSAALCDAIPDHTLDSRAYDIMLRAAELGNTIAANCYVGGYFSVAEPRNEQAAAQYGANALRLARKGVEKGDWAMVALLATAYAGDSPGPYGLPLVPPSRVQEYAYTRLQSLGAVGDFASRRQAKLDSIARSGSVSPEELTAADIWAQETYENYFRDSLIDHLPKPCSDD